MKILDSHILQNTFKRNNYLSVGDVFDISFDHELNMFVFAENDLDAEFSVHVDVEAFQLFINECQELLDEHK